MIKVIITAACICCLCGLPASKSIAQSDTRIQVVTEFLAPYQLRDPAGKVYGFAPEVVDRLFALSGYQQQRQALPWARAYESALTGHNIMIFSIARTAHREDKFHWIGSLSTERLHFWGLAARFNQKLNSMEELHKFQIAISLGTNPEQYLTAIQHPKLYRVADAETSLAMLLNNRTDLIIGSDVEFAERVRKFGRNIEEFYPVFEIDDLNSNLSIAFSLDTDPDILRRFRRAYKKLAEEGELQKLRDKWSIPE
ncbi:MAG: substrate-binding periplasmic protein [Aestuariibacter sp.]